MMSAAIAIALVLLGGTAPETIWLKLVEKSSRRLVVERAHGWRIHVMPSSGRIGRRAHVRVFAPDSFDPRWGLVFIDGFSAHRDSISGCFKLDRSYRTAGEKMLRVEVMAAGGQPSRLVACVPIVVTSSVAFDRRAQSLRDRFASLRPVDAPRFIAEVRHLGDPSLSDVLATVVVRADLARCRHLALRALGELGAVWEWRCVAGALQAERSGMRALARLVLSSFVHPDRRGQFLRALQDDPRQAVDWFDRVADGEVARIEGS